MTSTEQANQIISLMQSWGLSYKQMLEVIALARRKLEAIKQEEELNKPCKQIKLEL